MTRRLAALALATLAVAGCTESGPREDSSVLPTDERAVVASVTDGDTIRLRDGQRVRLVQIDAPEVNDRAECGGQEAAAALSRRLPPGTRVRLEPEATASAVDDFGRPLRYVYIGDMNLNLWMVEHGHAAPYFYDGQRGRFAAQLQRSARQARASKAGFWRHCPNAKLNAARGVNTGPPLRAH